jgi:Glyoxalase/Bleomycin resistance protein/Dioxygenase superfamily
VPGYARQRDFFTGTWGLTSEHDDAGLSFLAAEGSPEQYIVRLRGAADKRVDLIAFGAASAADVDTLAERLARDSVRLISEPLMHPRMGEMMWFLRINAWHHSLAIARGPHPSLHHVSFELRGIDEYMRGTGRLLRSGVEKIWGPGRHLAGNNTFSYFLDPHGNTLEYTTELEQVDEDTWHPHLYDFSQPDVADQWGTANAMNEFVARKSFNDIDKGLFVAPPA